MSEYELLGSVSSCYRVRRKLCKNIRGFLAKIANIISTKIFAQILISYN